MCLLFMIMFDLFALFEVFVYVMFDACSIVFDVRLIGWLLIDLFVACVVVLFVVVGFQFIYVVCVVCG